MHSPFLTRGEDERGKVSGRYNDIGRRMSIIGDRHLLRHLSDSYSHETSGLSFSTT